MRSMKQLLFGLTLILCVLQINAQTSIGGFIMFPDSKMWGSAYKPQISFGIVEGKDYLLLAYCDPDRYASFDENSRLLLKFEDDTVCKLPFDVNIGVVKNYDNSVSGGHIARFFRTCTSYLVDKGSLERIMGGIKIIKIRVVFANGEVEDFDIHSKYQEKLVIGLADSYSKAVIDNKQRIKNMTSDENF